MRRSKRVDAAKLTLGALLTALVVVLQLVGNFIHFSVFSVSLVLLPIVIGAATCGPFIGAWLGLVFGAVVLLSGDAALFLQFNAPATIVLVFLKGMASGLLAGLVYRLLEKFHGYVAVVTAAAVCPLVNTGIFLGGCYLFFYDLVAEWAGGSSSVVTYMFVGLAGGNFLFEFILNLVLCPVIVRILTLRRKTLGEKLG